MSGDVGKRVCIVGGGAYGLVTLKNFLEQGFDVTLYERNDHIAGLWRVSEDTAQTTALSGTVSNISKFMGCYSDFPFSEDANLHPTANEVQAYLESYADKFGLWKHIRLSRPVSKVERHPSRRNLKWLVTTPCTSGRDGVQTIAYDRLILATGANNKPVIPSIQNADLFAGEIIHSQRFKDPSLFAGKTVIVVGSGQTAADSVEFLRAAGAKKIYMSHRRSFLLLPRMLAGKPTECIVSRRFLLSGSHDKKKDAQAAEDAAFRNLQGLRTAIWPELKGNAAFAESREKPLLHASLPVVCDSIAENLISGAVESVQAIDRITGPSAVALKDGKIVDDVDAIIQCSGNTFDFGSLLPAEVDPTNPALAPDQFNALKETKYYRKDLTLCRAYKRFISMQEPHSLSFMGHAVSKTVLGLFPFYDLMSMALAQLWSGATPMPKEIDMEQECNEYFSSLAVSLNKSEVGLTGLISDLDYEDWLHEIAGTGVSRRLGGGGWTEWKLWLTDRRLYCTLMDGLNSPHSMRLFETGKRQAWNGARAAIEKANQELEVGAKR